jgi:aspartate/methionine/tyrosine aminotransferase
VVVNPGNPTGAYANVETIQAAAAKANMPLIADEVFRPFTLDATTAGASFAEAPESLCFTLDGVSKRLAAPGIKLGWIRLTGPPELTAQAAAQLDQIADAYLTVSTAAAAALPAMLELEATTQAAVRARTSINLKLLREVWPGRVRSAEAGWVAVVDAPAPEPDLELRLLAEHRLSVHPGWFYGLPGNRALVVSLLPTPDRFAANLERLIKAVDASPQS